MPRRREGLFNFGRYGCIHCREHESRGALPGSHACTVQIRRLLARHDAFEPPRRGFRVFLARRSVAGAYPRQIEPRMALRRNFTKVLANHSGRAKYADFDFCCMTFCDKFSGGQQPPHHGLVNFDCGVKLRFWNALLCRMCHVDGSGADQKRLPPCVRRMPECRLCKRRRWSRIRRSIPRRTAGITQNFFRFGSTRYRTSRWPRRSHSPLSTSRMNTSARASSAMMFGARPPCNVPMFTVLDRRAVGSTGRLHFAHALKDVQQFVDRGIAQFGICGMRHAAARLRLHNAVRLWIRAPVCSPSARH